MNQSPDFALLAVIERQASFRSYCFSFTGVYFVRYSNDVVSVLGQALDRIAVYVLRCAP